MNNITELRESLTDNYKKMKSGEMELREGKELSNCAGKIIQSLKIELEYNTLLNIKSEIPYLKSE